MTNLFEKATKKKARLRMAITGPAKSGKTYTGLTFATALANGGKIAVIDTERGSASKYADTFTFDVLELRDFDPANYIVGIENAEKAGYTVILIDSLSHAWESTGGILEKHADEVKRQRVENSFTAWRTITPQHNKLVEAMLQSGCHVIATMRTKTEWVMQENERGKMVPLKVGMAPIQRKGMEYEFDIIADMDYEHTMIISGSRCTAVADNVVEKPSAEWFEKVRIWLDAGIEAERVIHPTLTEFIMQAMQHYKLTKEQVEEAIGDIDEWTASEEQRGGLHKKLSSFVKVEEEINPTGTAPKHDPHTPLDEFVEKAAGYYKITEDQVKEIIGDVEWTGSQAQRQEAHNKLRSHDVS